MVTAYSLEPHYQIHFSVMIRTMFFFKFIYLGLSTTIEEIQPVYSRPYLQGLIYFRVLLEFQVQSDSVLFLLT